MLRFLWSEYRNFVTRTSTIAPDSPALAAEYRFSDGIALAESPWGMVTINHARPVLQHQLARSARAPVRSSENLLYAGGDPEKRLEPDLLVMRGLATLPQPPYRARDVPEAPNSCTRSARGGGTGFACGDGCGGLLALHPSRGAEVAPIARSAAGDGLGQATSAVERVPRDAISGRPSEVSGIWCLGMERFAKERSRNVKSPGGFPAIGAVLARTDLRLL